MKFTHAGHNTDWEACFENATEDISNFDNLLKVLENAHFSADSGHGLVSCLSCRSRGIQVINIIQQNNPPDEYRVYHKKLQLLMEAADSRLNRLLNDHSEFIISLFLPTGDLWGHVGHLERQLKALRRAFQDWLLFHEETDPPDDTLRDLAADFLLPFAEFYRASEDAPPSFKELADFQSWRSRFSELDCQFQACFGYLQPVADMLTRFWQRENHADFWWLTRKPDMAEVMEPELSDAWLQDIGRSEIIPSGEVCPESEMVIAYAFHELSGQKRLDVQNHVRSCSFCLNLVLDLRVAQDEARLDSQQPVDLMQFLSIAQKKHNLNAVSEWRHIPATPFFRELSSRFGEILNWPQSIPATLQNILELLFATPFKEQALPQMASDHDGDIIIAKLITLDAGGIQNISPVTVIINHLAQTDDGIVISGELPSEFQAIPDIDFGWQCPDNSVRILKTKHLERKGIYFVTCLEKPSVDRLDGGIRLVIVRKNSQSQ
jgi:hypothetical protein